MPGYGRSSAGTAQVLAPEPEEHRGHVWAPTGDSWRPAPPLTTQRAHTSLCGERAEPRRSRPWPFLRQCKPGRPPDERGSPPSARHLRLPAVVRRGLWLQQPASLLPEGDARGRGCWWSLWGGRQDSWAPQAPPASVSLPPTLRPAPVTNKHVVKTLLFSG